jgi:hypothetical protein
MSPTEAGGHRENKSLDLTCQALTFLTGCTGFSGFIFLIFPFPDGREKIQSTRALKTHNGLYSALAR